MKVINCNIFADMKPFYTKATSQFDNSFSIRYDEMPKFYPHWHYHDEYELVYIYKSEGIRYVGDNISPYLPGDLVLLGSKLPHIWINEQHRQSSEENLAASTVIHFQRKFVDNDFFAFPLMKPIRDMFLHSSRGIRFVEFNNMDSCLNEIRQCRSADKMIALLNLLNQLSNHSNIEYLSSHDYNSVAANQQNDRLSDVHEYIIRHFKEKISLEDLAEIAKMTPPAFCNYFKSKTRKTVFTYINDLKLGYSRKLLVETDLNIDQVAFQSGFNNTTFYNRKFKSKMQMTPKEYRKQFAIEA